MSSNFGLYEYLALDALRDTTKDSDIAEVVLKVVSTSIPEVQCSLLAGLTADEAPSITGKGNVAAALIIKHAHLLNLEQVGLTFHLLSIKRLCAEKH